MKRLINLKIISLLVALLFFLIHSIGAQLRYSGLDPMKDSQGVFIPDSTEITWISPSKPYTIIKSARVNIRATVKTTTGVISVLLYLNDVLYGQPEMSPSLTEKGSFIVSKTVFLPPGENGIYLVVKNREGTTISEKRNLTVPFPDKNLDSTEITWINPSKPYTLIKSAKVNIRATVKTTTGVISVLLYLNDVLYEDPEMSPSLTERGSFDVSKAVYLEPGENELYLIVKNREGTTISEKRNLAAQFPDKKPDSTTASVITEPRIVWTKPSNVRTTLISPKADIKATIVSPTGISSVAIYLNDVLYGEPEMSPSLTEKESYIVSKTLFIQPGENSIYLLVKSDEGSTVSEKRFFSVGTASKNPDASAIELPTAPTIIWYSPTRRNTMLGSLSTYVKATIRSASSVTSAVLYLNGVSQGEIEIKPFQDKAGSYQVEKKLDFKQIENAVYFEAINTAGIARSETRYFICSPDSLSTNYSSNQAKPKTEDANTANVRFTSKGDAPIKASSANEGPIITWTSPSGTHTTLESFNAIVKASIKSNSGLKSVLMYVNGISKGETEVRPLAESSGSYLMEKNLSFGPGENNIYLVATNSEGTTKSELRYFSNPSAVVPVITWSNPVTINSLVNIESFVVGACIQSPIELKSVKLLVNGNIQIEDAVFQASADDDCNYNWKGSIVLKEGDNNIYIIATNIAGSATSEKRIIKLNAAYTEKRLALVFGNSLYENKTPLKNPVNDANLMEGTLKDLGFEVIKRLNSSREEMMTAIREFNEKLSDYNVALFYYAGHGHQVDGKNYLIPTDAILEKPGDCKYEAIEVNFIVEEFENYQDNTNIVILDACRSNPFASWVRGGEAGFRSMNFTSGTIIGFATSEDATAADGKGDNGLYTQELVKQMNIHQPISSVFMNTRVQVRKLSNNQQIPTEENKLNGEFYFRK